MKNSLLLRWSIVVSLAGFIFGFDTVVISGANQPIKALWHTSPLFHGFFIMSMALWGTVVGALFGGIPTQIFGRKKVLLWVGILFTASAFGTALANNPYVFSFFRFVGGIGIGISSVVAPIYISEIATPTTRGRLVALYQFNIVFGILVAYISNYALIGFGGSNDWRWMLGVLAVPSVLYTLLVFGIAESPRWLLTQKNETQKAKDILIKSGVTDVEAAVASMLASPDNEEQAGRSAELFNKKNNRLVGLAFLIAFFNQLSGINFILYYAPEILEQSGLAEQESLFNSIAIGSTNLLFTFVGLFLIDRLGRKTLLLIGSLGYIVSLSMVAYAFYSEAGPIFLMTFLLMFIAAHAIGQGAVIWVFLSEIFPTHIRSAGQSFGASIHWIFAAIITLVTPVFLDKKEGIFKDDPWPIFAFFAGMMVLQLIWVMTRVPETKGVSLEELEKKLMQTDMTRR